MYSQSCVLYSGGEIINLSDKNNVTYMIKTAPITVPHPNIFSSFESVWAPKVFRARFVKDLRVF